MPLYCLDGYRLGEAFSDYIQLSPAEFFLLLESGSETERKAGSVYKVQEVGVATRQNRG